MDAAELARGYLADLKGLPMMGKSARYSTDQVRSVGVTDAKDCYDKISSDNNSFGAQKSLAFTVAWLRTLLRRPNVGIRWTATANMFADGATKDMDTEQLRRVLREGEW